MRQRSINVRPLTITDELSGIDGNYSILQTQENLISFFSPLRFSLRFTSAVIVNVEYDATHHIVRIKAGERIVE